MAVVAQLCMGVSNIKSLFLVHVLGTHRWGNTRSTRYDFDAVLCFQNHLITFVRKQHVVFKWLSDWCLELRLMLNFNLVLQPQSYVGQVKISIWWESLDVYLSKMKCLEKVLEREKNDFTKKKIHPVVEIHKNCVLITRLIDPRNKNSKSEITVHKSKYKLTYP